MSGMERLQRMFAGAGGALGHPPPDSPTLDSSEQVYISSLALLKMLKHGTLFYFLSCLPFARISIPNSGLVLLSLDFVLMYGLQNPK
jgi:hypothetical protein